MMVCGNIFGVVVATTRVCLCRFVSTYITIRTSPPTYPSELVVREQEKRISRRAAGTDGRFSFPDRRHSSYSEVYPRVSVSSRLISCPASLPVLRSVSRSECLPSRHDVRPVFWAVLRPELALLYPFVPHAWPASSQRQPYH